MTATATIIKFNKPADHVHPAINSAAANPTSLVGTWVNVDAATRAIVRVVFTLKAGTLEVNAYGACSPTPCNWGRVAARTYAASVTGGTAVALSASYAFGFKNTILTGHLDGDDLIIEEFNVFTDGSGRAAYFTRDIFEKV
jgi:hypothetical protein